MSLFEETRKILAEEPIAAWDDLCHLAAQICGASMAFIAFQDEMNEHLKAWIGPRVECTGRLGAFGLNQQPFRIIEDLADDEALRLHPFVREAPFCRFYAGAALVTREGATAGFLGVLDPRPRVLSPDQITSLHRLAAQAMILHESYRLREAERMVGRLVHEMNHRIKNSLAVVQAIMSLTARTCVNPADFQSVFTARIGAFAKAQSLLNDEHWQTIRLDAVVAGILAPHVERLNCPFEACGPSVAVASDLAVMLGMALHELAVNALHHGAFSTPGGRLDLGWSLQNTGERSQLRLHWREHGGPRVSPPHHKGFGVKLIERVLGGQFHAEIDLRYAPEGFALVLLIPLQNERGGEPS
ncbi:sensor histidine kinase [Beijerinckia indica]|uniref:histidine kinase n=1 Tax=Beijerinckia indica subsp. indica (strain ATCC 9039 / DSM 1715 / NCIMB 8712) TaxID=395963 RepID=B2IK45_BEII9|nr:HWE histidine kinase domain-containing protein [Beijerinckia indica]ACB94977.1 signal transduction histidine kinase [Beijerinckia indica subsp. indica ATCC 9039]